MMFKSYFPERHSGGSKIWGGDVLWLAEEKKALSGSGKQDKKLLPKCGSNGAWNNIAMEQAEAAILENTFPFTAVERELSQH